MLLLIAESKTMAACDSPVSQAALAAHTPLLEERAAALVESLRGLTATRLASLARLTPTLATRLRRSLDDFPCKATGGRAISAYTGVVMKALGWSSLSQAARVSGERRLRIISSLYGWLRPDDIIKPYRLDFTSRVAPGGLSMAAWWRDSVTDVLLDTLADGGHDDVLDLLPGDAMRCIDRRRLDQAAHVWHADFKQVRGDRLRTPDSTRLKTLRGQLLRRILETGINSPAELASLDGPDFMARGMTDDNTLLFLTP